MVWLIAAVLLMAGFAQATAITVCPTGCDYKSIQSAVYAAKSGDTIEVQSGTYNESVVLTKDINFKGVDTGSGEPIVNGGLYKNSFSSSLRGFSFLDVSSSLPYSYKMVNQNTTLYWIENATEIAAKSPTKGLAAINKIIQANPKDARAWFRKGYILCNSQRYEDSSDAYNESLKTDPGYYYTFCNIGDNFYSLKMYNESIQFYDKAIELRPSSASLWNSKGNAFYIMSKYDEALKAYEKAIELAPNTGVYWDNKGGALKHLNRTDEADAAYAKAKELGYTG